MPNPFAAENPKVRYDYETPSYFAVAALAENGFAFIFLFCGGGTRSIEYPDGNHKQKIFAGNMF